MGSGISGNYSGITQASQSYASFYHVTKDMLERDKQDSNIYNPNTGYFKNPTTTNLEKSITDNRIYIGGKRAHGTMTYIMDEKGNVLFGIRKNPNNLNKRAPHPTLLGGKDPIVKCAGMITFSKGKIVSVNNSSGHYKPNIKSMELVDRFMERLLKSNKELFDKQSKWRKKHDNN